MLNRTQEAGRRTADVRVSLCAVFSAAVVVAAALACSDGAQDSDGAQEQVPETGQQRQRYSTLATERIIPVRVIQCLPSAGAPDNMSVGALNFQIEFANSIFKAAGVQFYVSKNERHVMDSFTDVDEDSQPTWADVRGELQGPFPNLNLNRVQIPFRITRPHVAAEVSRRAFSWAPAVQQA